MKAQYSKYYIVYLYKGVVIDQVQLVYLNIQQKFYMEKVLTNEQRINVQEKFSKIFVWKISKLMGKGKMCKG